MDAMDKIEVNGITYVRESKTATHANLPYMMVRTKTAGVFAGYLNDRNGMEVELLQARRIYQWAGAATLSQLAQSGTSTPLKCKFPEPVSSVLLTEAIELIPITETAKATIDAVPIWKA